MTKIILRTIVGSTPRQIVTSGTITGQLRDLIIAETSGVLDGTHLRIAQRCYARCGNVAMDSPYARRTLEQAEVEVDHDQFEARLQQKHQDLEDSILAMLPDENRRA